MESVYSDFAYVDQPFNMKSNRLGKVCSLVYKRSEIMMSFFDLSLFITQFFLEIICGYCERRDLHMFVLSLRVFF